MAQSRVSLKRIGIDKTNSRIVIMTAVSAFLIIFCSIASYTLAKQMLYQNKVMSINEKAVTQLKANLKNSNDLAASYQAFVATPQNILGGNPTGVGPKDGNNAKIVLDALPSTYDFPALTSSLEKLATDQGVSIKSLTGSDDSVNQNGAAGAATAPAQSAVPMPFDLSVTGNYNAIQGVVTAMERSIRPIQVQKLELSGDQNELKLDVSAQTFYQPAKGLNITKKAVTR